MVMISSELIPILLYKNKQTRLVVNNKAMQFESKTITGNGRLQTSRESTYFRDLSTFVKSCAT